ncbi:efflux RND transporter permease subunit [Gimesia aquarii]|uniref:Multidrug resistance protein MdtC n=1 Tax=Gimesia aquarii TaxID=2527964 RepID=A0A517VZE0_9PLAN|nr:efflux RND transporter permease subunit [Gimesia aquarii]QDT98367.1 Multidrug resistance protein MdtC [Gimesia aquarii]
MSLTRLAVHRPITTLMASLVLVMLGCVSLSQLAVDLMPDIQNPSVSVITIYKGAGPSEAETLITRPIEQTLSSVAGVENILSSSVEGSSTVRLQFQWGTDLNLAINEVRDSLNKLRNSLPEGAEDPYIRHFDVADSPIIYFGLNSDLDPITLTRVTENQIIPQFEQLDGVARVRMRGGIEREIQINLDRSKLESLNMGVNEVINALQQDNINQPAGNFEEGHLNLHIRSQGEFTSLEQIENTVVREKAGATVRVRDVADVVDGEKERTELTRMNGQPGILLYVYKQSGANTISVSDLVRKQIERVNKSSSDVNLSIRVDKAEFIRQSIANIQEAALYGMGLAFLVLILFLRSFRSMLVIGVCMPLSVLATFILIYFQGFTLNIISFGGLALGVGLLVDNSIVVLESIFRKREEGLDPIAAAIEGTAEVSAAIVASTLTTLIIFLPLVFIQGATGILLHQLAWVVSFSLICSLFASLTLTPVMSAYWIPAETKKVRSKWSKPWFATIETFHNTNHKILLFLERIYERILRFSLKHSTMTGFTLLVCFTATLGLSPRIKTEFLPKTDEATVNVFSRMAAGIQLKKLDQQTRILEQATIKSVPEAVAIASFIGDSADDADRWNRTTLRIQLSPRSERKRGIEEIRKALDDAIGPVPGMKFQVKAQTEMMLMRMISRRGGGDLVVQVAGHNLQLSQEIVEQVVEVMKQIPGLINVEAEISDQRPELTASIDRDKAGLLKISVQDIAQTLETTIQGTEATLYREDGDEFSVVVRLRETDRDRLSDVQQVGVTTETGRTIPLKNLLQFKTDEAPVVIERQDQQRVLRIFADVEGRDLGSIVPELEQHLNSIQIPAGFSIRVAGDWESQQKSFDALKQGFVLAIILMYMVMASQYESLRDPFYILFSVPLGMIGVIWVFVFTETTLNVQSFIGIVVLSGIVVNNAIVLVDYINQLRRRFPDKPLSELIIQAATRRFRPILMTTLTTVLAMIPIALGWGEGGELQAPMARVVVGGLCAGTIITLLAIPLIYQTCTGSVTKEAKEKHQVCSENPPLGQAIKST